MDQPAANQPSANRSAGYVVDATLCAHSGALVERDFTAAELPRMREAGAHEGTTLSIKGRFSKFEGRVAIDGQIAGVAVLTCQRCMKPLSLALSEEFKVILVESETDLEQEPGGYEPVLAYPARFDVHALAEDQGLLALPLVPKHEVECTDARVEEPEPVVEQGTQRPFGNLKDLMRRQ